MITVLYLATFILIALLCMNRIRKNEGISLYPIFLLVIGVLYLFVPAMIFMFASYDNQNSDLVRIISDSTTYERIDIYLLVLLCVAVVSIPQKVRIGGVSSHALNNSAEIYDVVRVKNISYGVCRVWFLILLSIGLGCTLIMIAEIGVSGFILYSGSSRGEGSMELQSGSLFAYASNFSRWLIASLAPGLLMYEIKKRRSMKILLYFVFVLSMLLQIFNAGKTNFILFLVPFFIYLMSKRGSFKMKHLIIAAVVIILLVPFLDNAFYYISTGEAIGKYRESWSFLNYMMSVVRQFTYPYANMVMRVPITEIYGYRWLLDYLAIPVNLIPASLLGGFQLDTLYHITTEYYASILSSKGGMPNDFLFFAYRQFGVFGIAIIGTITGAIIKKLDKILFEVKDLLAILKINTSHFFTTYWLTGVVFILIEPLSVFTSFPMVIFTVMIGIHLKRRSRGARILSK